MKILKPLFFALVFVCSLWAFKAPSHIAVANEAMAEMKTAIENGNGGAKLVFHDIELPVSNASAFNAIVANPTYYRMGSAGPDAFPDMVSGQTWMHTNNGATVELSPLRTYEDRMKGKPMETFRSIDYAMSMIKEASLANDAATLAFALGYLGHCVSDGFSHGWVNRQAGDFFDYKTGSGIFGVLTEEVKHIESEALLDSKLPPELVGMPDSANELPNMDRLRTDAPYAFLDKFYATRVNGEHLGGMLYDYWDIQESVLDKISSVGDMDYLASLPDMEAGSATSIAYIFGNNDILKGLIETGGVETVLSFLGPKLKEINPVHYYFSEVRANYGDLRNQLKSHRRNWMVMGKCTAQNMVTLKIPNAPDNCPEVGASGTDIDVGTDWNRSANQELHRREIVAAFNMKEGGDSHSTADNVERAAQYLLGGLVLADIPGTLVPADWALGWTQLLNFLKNNSGLNAALLAGPILLAHTAICLTEGAVKEVGCVVDCVDETAACISRNAKWCSSTDRDWCDRWWGKKVCVPGLVGTCVATMATGCTVGGAVSCVVCSADAIYETLDDCLGDPIRNWDDLGGMLARDLEDITAAIDRIKRKAMNVVEEQACAAAKAQGVPVEKLYRTVGLFKSMSQLAKSGEYAAVNVAFLAEDIKDSAWYQTLINSTTRSDEKALLESMHNGTFATFTAVSELNPIEVPKNCFDFKFNAESDFTKDPQFATLGAIQSLAHTPGPTATRFLAEFGSDPTKEFPPMFNAIQGNLLVGVNTKADLENLYAIGGVNTPTLQWSSDVSANYSEICKKDPVSIFCDVIPSLDDPDCIKCEDKAGVIGGERNFEVVPKQIGTESLSWYTRKSLVGYNLYDVKNPPLRPFDNTAFPLASSSEAVEKLYKKIFMVPTSMPGFTGFEDPKNPWTSDVAILSQNTQNKTQGLSSLQVVGSGYMPILSPVFNTSDFGVYSNQVSFDVWIPANQPNPWWIGQSQMFVDLPSAGINNQPLGGIELTSLNLGAWNTLTFTLPEAVVTALADDKPNMQFTIVLNVNATVEPFLVDNFRFTGNVVSRTVMHQSGSKGLNVIVPDIFSFDDAERWNSTQVQLSNNTVNKVEGTASMLVTGKADFRSVSFNTWQLTNITNKLNVEVYVPNPQPNKWWLGALQLSFDCPEAGVYNQYLGQKDLTHLFRNEFNSVVFDLSAETVARLKANAGGCTFQYSLNVNNGSGQWFFDKMGFINAPGVVKGTPVPPTSGSTPPTSGFTCTGGCLSAIIASNPYQTYTLATTGEAWYVLNQAPKGWQGSEMAGRTASVNGVSVVLGANSLPAAVNGKWYFKFSAGQHSWASWSWWP
jgi:hypothetical protein